MWERCKHVAITYLTRKALLFGWLFLLLMSLPSFFVENVPAGNTSRDFAMLLSKLMFLMFFGFGLGAHLKHQFANPRSRLLPGFCGAQLSVAMLLFVAGVAWSALPACWSSGVSVLGFSAIALHVGALGLWIGCSPYPAVGVSLMLTIGTPMSPVGRALVVEITTGAEPILALSLISAHVAALVLLFNHLVKLNEDDPDYSKVQSFDAWDMRSATQRNFLRNVSMNGNWMLSLMSASAAGRLERATAAPATTSHQRVALFGLGDDWPSSLWMNVVVLVAVEVVLLLMGGRDRIQSAENLSSALFLPMLVSFALVWGLWMPWLQRWSRLGYESLRPVSRHDWVWENGVAIAKTMARTHAAVTLIQVLIVAFLFPKFLTEPSLWEALIWVSGCQVLLFGVCAWLTSHGSLLAMGMGMGMVIGPCLGLLNAPWGKPLELGWGIPLTVCLSVVVSLIGAACSRFAFKRWCQMDLP